MKRTVFRNFMILVAMVSITITTTAQLHATERAVTLHEIIAIAKESNGGLRALREEIGIGEAGRIKAGLYPNPVLDLEGATGALTGSSSESRLSFGVSQEFLTGGKREKRLAVAESELVRFGGQIKDAERMLLLEVKTGFYDLLLLENRLELAHKSQELNNQLLQITRERLAAGDIAELEVNLARVETARGEGRKVEVERELVPARQRLLSLMGSYAVKELKITDSPGMASFTMNLAELKAMALKNRPDLQALESEKNKGEAEVTLALAERLPNLTAGIGVSRESTLISIGALEDRSTDYLIGLKLSVPIPFFDQNQAALKEARVRQSSAEIRQAFVRQSIEREVEAAHARLAAAEKSLNIYTIEIVPQLTENLKLVQEAYRLGEVGILALLEEQKKYTEVNEGHLSALYSRNTALAKLEAAVGIELNKFDGGKK